MRLSDQWAEWFIQTVKDFRRCIDYLETRQDVDSKKIAYYGMSEGGIYGRTPPIRFPSLIQCTEANIAVVAI